MPGSAKKVQLDNCGVIEIVPHIEQFCGMTPAEYASYEAYQNVGRITGKERGNLRLRI